MQQDLKLSGYSPSTCKIYLVYARLFAKFHMRSPAEMSEPEIREFLLHLIEERKISRQTFRQVRAGLTFLYTVTLRRPTEVDHLAIPRREVRLPEVLSGTEVAGLLAAVRNPKYHGLLMTMYAAGLRVAEACRLRPEDLDSKRMVILVRGGKGGRDRYTTLSERLLVFLRDYWRKTRPQGWLFPSRAGTQHVTPDAVYGLVREVPRIVPPRGRMPDSSRTPSGSSRSSTSPRHPARTPITSQPSECSLRTTALYTYVSPERVAATPSPLDLLGTPDSSVLG